MIGPKYREFFSRQANERHIFLQGGRRSGKTFATFQFINALMAVRGNAEGRLFTCVVLCSEFPLLQNTIRDFKEIFNVDPVNTKDGRIAFTDGGRWLFIHSTTNAKVQGTKGDYLFANEAVEIPYHVLKNINQGITEQRFYNFNPTGAFDFMKSRLTGNNLLCTTWRDNPYLTPAQIEEFELLKTDALKPDATIIDIRQYKVFYLGEFDQSVGAIFSNVTQCTVADYYEIPAEEAVAIDFGFAVSGDPTTCIGVKLHDKKIYVHQYIYQQGLTSNEELSDRLASCGFNEYTRIFGDYGGNGRGRMDDLIMRGWNICNAIKTKILDGLNQMNLYKEVCITNTSYDTIKEFQNYQLNEDNRLSGSDHAIDAARYAFEYLHLS